MYVWISHPFTFPQLPFTEDTCNHFGDFLHIPYIKLILTHFQSFLKLNFAFESRKKTQLTNHQCIFFNIISILLAIARRVNIPMKVTAPRQKQENRKSSRIFISLKHVIFRFGRDVQNLVRDNRFAI